MEARTRQGLKYIGDQLAFGEMPLSKVLAAHPTPLYLYSEHILTENYQEFENCAKERFKDFDICFALKANPNLNFLKILAGLGSGADIVSIGELERALEAGIPAKKIVFSGVGKQEREIDRALEVGINSFNIESLEELEMVNARAKLKQTKARVALRLNPKVQALTHKYISTGFKTHKFGILQNDILTSLENESFWTNSRLVGLSVHIGSQLTNLDATAKATQALCECAQKLPFKLEFLDVGGGLGVNYSSSQKPKAPSAKEYMKLVSDNISLKYPVKIIFEPGRKIAASSGVFVSSVIRSKQSEDCRFLIVDGGMNDFARPSLYGAFHEIYPSKKSKKTLPTDIVGPICESADCFGEQRLMPLLEPKDFIAIADAGAYGYSMASNYNMREKPLEILLRKDGTLSPTKN